MKQTLLTVAFVFGIFSIAFSQNQGPTEEVTTLKKQVTNLKQTNSKLDQSVKELKKTTKNLQDSLSKALKEFDTKLSAMQDSLNAGAASVHRIKVHSAMTDHALKTRKTVFYIVFVLVVILLIISYYLLTKMLKTSKENLDVRIMNVKDDMLVTLNKTKNDHQLQIAAVKAEIASAKEGFEKKMKEAKK